LYRTYQQQIVACDQEIETLLREFAPKVDPTQKPLPPDSKRNRAARKRRKKTGNPDTTFDLRTEAYKLIGVDVTQIPGVETIALPLFSEIGRDLSNWPTGPHFTSWLALCPDNDISGGQVLWKGMRKVNNRAVLVTVLPLPPRRSDISHRSVCDTPCSLRPTIEGSAFGLIFVEATCGFTFVAAR
jgi:hypothetical protein